MSSKTSVLAMVALFLGLLLTAGGTYAQEELEVTISPDPSVAAHTHEHDITVRAIQRGTTEFTLKGKAADSHSVTFTRNQRSDLLDGTALIVDSGSDSDDGDYKAHKHRVRIIYKGVERESSGW